MTVLREMDEMYWQSGDSWPENAAKTIDYPEEPLFDMLDRAARNSGDLPYTVFMGKSQTFAEVKEHSDRIANFLVSKGIKEGDRVAIFLPNVPHFPPAFFGALKTGAKVVTCNPLYKVGELNYQLKDTEAQIVFVLDHPTFTPTAYEAIKGSDCLVITTDWPQFKKLDIKKVKKLLRRPIIIDGRNMFEPAKMRKAGINYISVGRS